jgi:putative transposase
MARRPRFVLPEVAHHVTQRGNNRQQVFFSDADRVRYLHLLRRYANRHKCRILGWCLMTNHVHLIIVPGTAHSLALVLGQAHSQYSLEINREREWVGHVWQNRFYSCTLDAPHLLAALGYTELNPVRAGMAACAWDWPWSSARAHTAPHVADPLLDWLWREWMEEARVAEWNYADWKAALSVRWEPERLERLRRATRLGEPLGSDGFLQQLEAAAGRRLRVGERGRPPASGAFPMARKMASA